MKIDQSNLKKEVASFVVLLLVLSHIPIAFAGNITILYGFNGSENIPIKLDHQGKIMTTMNLSESTGLSPEADNNYDIGSISRRWQNGYFVNMNLYGSLNGTSLKVSGNSYLAASTGNVGVGTVTPNQKLVVIGTANITQGLNVTGGLRVSELNTASCDLKADTDGNFFCGTDSTGSSSAFGNENITGLHINVTTLNVSGNTLLATSTDAAVGIGTTNPGEPLHIIADSGNDLIRLEETTGGQYYTVEVDSSGDLRFLDDGSNIVVELTSAPDVTVISGQENNPGLGFVGDANTGLFSETGDTFGFSAGGIEMFTLVEDDTQDQVVVNEDGDDTDFRVEASGGGNSFFVEASSGNVGINTTSPIYALQVFGGSNISNVLFTNNNDNVGIDTTNPEDPLHILTDSDGDAIHLEENSGGEDWQIGVDSAGDLNFEDSGGVVITFEDGGDVGIGTASPTEELTIAGAFCIDGDTSCPTTASSGDVFIADGDLMVCEGDSCDNDVANADGDVYVEDDIEIDGGICVEGSNTCDTINGGDVEIKDGSVCIGDAGCDAPSSGDGYLYVETGLGIGTETILDAVAINGGLCIDQDTDCPTTPDSGDVFIADGDLMVCEGDSCDNDVANADGDVYVEDDIEIDGGICVEGSNTCDTINGGDVEIKDGSVCIGDAGCDAPSSGDGYLYVETGLGIGTETILDAVAINGGLCIDQDTDCPTTPDSGDVFIADGDLMVCEGDSCDNDVANADGDVYVEDDIEIDGGLCLEGATTCSTPGDGDLELEDGAMCIGDGGCDVPGTDGYLHVEGRVGVGTPSPAQQLHVEGGNLLVNGTGSNINMFIQSTDDNAILQIRANEDNGSSNPGNNDPRIDLFYNATRGAEIKVDESSQTFEISSHGQDQGHFVIDSSGEVGIGTNTPSEELHVLGDANSDIAINIENDNTGDDAHAVLYITAGGAGNNADAKTIFTGAGNTMSVGVDNSDGDKFKISDSTFLGTNTRIAITEGGDVGIGTDGPSYLLHINDSHADTNYLSTSEPTLTLSNNDGTDGNYVAMAFNGVDSDGTQRLGGGFGVEFNNRQSSSNFFDSDFFWVTRSVTTSNTYSEKMRLTASGNLGIGTDSPDYGLDVVQDINSDDCFRESGSQIAGTCSSDIRLKKNIKPLQGSLNKLLQLKPVEFEWKEDIDELGQTIRYIEGRQVGMIAQDVQKVMPDLIVEKDGYLSVRYNLEMDMMMLNAIQELNEKIDSLQQENNELRKEIKQIKETK